MKYPILILLIFIKLNIYSQNVFFTSTCNCIEKISETKNQSIIAEKIQNCFKSSFQNHNSEIDSILREYVKEKPETDINSAKKNLSTILTKKLTENCPKFKTIDEKLNSQKQNSREILKTVADEICIELTNIDNLSDNTVEPILWKITQKHQVSIYGQYNLSDKNEMKNYSYSLNDKLINDCPVYKEYVIKKNKSK